MKGRQSARHIVTNVDCLLTLKNANKTHSPVCFWNPPVVDLAQISPRESICSFIQCILNETATPTVRSKQNLLAVVHFIVSLTVLFYLVNPGPYEVSRTRKEFSDHREKFKPTEIKIYCCRFPSLMDRRWQS